MQVTEQYFLWYFYYAVQGGTDSIKESLNCDHSIERCCIVIFFFILFTLLCVLFVALNTVGEIRKCAGPNELRMVPLSHTEKP